MLLELVIDRQGVARSITVLRPLGFGLDEAAADAIAKWRFSPGTQAGKPINLVTTVEVGFHLLGSKNSRDAELQ